MVTIEFIRKHKVDANQQRLAIDELAERP